MVAKQQKKDDKDIQGKQQVFCKAFVSAFCHLIYYLFRYLNSSNTKNCVLSCGFFKVALAMGLIYQ